MAVFYSATTRGFYDTAAADYTLPEDAVEVTAREHARLMERQQRGAIIVAQENGHPIDVTPEVSIQTQARILLRGGLTITGAGVPAGVYSCDDVSVSELSMVLVGIAAGFGFPGGTSYKVRLLDAVTPPVIAVFVEPSKLMLVAKAVFAFRYHCLQAANGFTNVLPDNRVTL